MTETWTLFLSNLKEENKVPIFNALEASSISKKGENKILIRFDSSSSQAEFENVKRRFIKLLANKLNNHSIEILMEIKENKNVKYVLNNQEKYEELLKKNPLLEKLKNDLKLEF